MKNNLFEQAKEMMNNFTTHHNNEQNHVEHEKEAVRKAIQAAYNDATPEQKTQLQHFEQQLDKKIDLH